MAKYCDSVKLEHNWFRWIVASSVPALEIYRINGLLWTKVVGKTEDKDLPDPTYPRRLHCIALEKRVRLTSESGRIVKGKPALLIPMCEQIDKFGLPNSDSEDLEKSGYYFDRPTVESWQAVLEDIGKICKGISMKFCLNCECARHDLTQDAFLQVINKLQRGKLVYVPGRAPVFNLLTTTIHRCMCSVLSRNTRQSQNLTSYLGKCARGFFPEAKRRGLVHDDAHEIRTDCGSRVNIGFAKVD